jgi:hypothetical protein
MHCVRFRLQAVRLLSSALSVCSVTAYGSVGCVRVIRRPPRAACPLRLYVEQHPDKTLIGRISRGFDFLGYGFTPAGLDAAPQTIEKCVERVSQLYEQGADMIHIGAYVRRWLRWARSGLRALGEGLAERALGLVWLSLRRLGWPACAPPVLRPAFANQHVGEPANNPNTREQQR